MSANLVRFLLFAIDVIVACSGSPQEPASPHVVPVYSANATTDGACPSEVQLAELRRQTAIDVALVLTPGPGLTQDDPASSCSDVSAGRSSGYYWVLPASGPPAVQMYCDFNRQCGCDGPSTWTRVAYLDMSIPHHNCPSGWRIATTSVRACTGRGLSRTFECNSAFFSTYQLPYSRVCGRVLGYQHGAPDAFNELVQTGDTIEESYLDGISITHGGAGDRQHIWSFAGAQGDSDPDLPPPGLCDCTNSNAWPYSTGFIGSDYFCDSGNHQASVDNSAPDFYPNDPLWDGAGCGPSSTCCQFNSPPWFCKALPQPTTDDLEVRICHSRGTEDTPVQIVELFVQ